MAAFFALLQTVIISIFIGHPFQIRPTLGGKLPLLRYNNPHIVDHFYTTDHNELGAGKNGWDFEGVQCLIEPLGTYGASELYRYWNEHIGDHFYTISYAELGAGRDGYIKEGSPGSCYSSKKPGLVPLYRYNNGNDHFYTTSAAEIGTTTIGATGNHGYKYEGIACYVYPYTGYSAVDRLPFDMNEPNGYYTISFGNSSVFTFIVYAIGILLIVNIIMMVYTYCYKSSGSTKVAYKKVYMDSDGADV